MSLLLGTIDAKAQVRLIDYSSKCEDIVMDKRIFARRISNIFHYQDTTEISITFAGMCGDLEKGSVELVNDSINLIATTDSNDIVLCDCFYELKFKLIGVDSSKKYLLNGVKIEVSPSKYAKPIIQSYQVVDNDTINRIDHLERKQGYWKEYFSDSYVIGDYINNHRIGIWRFYNKQGLNYLSHSYSMPENVYESEELVNNVIEVRQYYTNGNIKMLTQYVDNERIIYEYAESGAIRRYYKQKRFQLD